MVFAGQLDAMYHHPFVDRHRNLLLENLTKYLRFPPAVRAMYLFITRRNDPTPEDRAALIQSLYIYAKSIYRGPRYAFDLGESQTLFGKLRSDLTAITSDLDQDQRVELPYLHAFDTLVLGPPSDGAGSPNYPTIFRPNIAKHYRSGVLRRTLFRTVSEVPPIERLSAFWGDRSDRITYLRSGFPHLAAQTLEGVEASQAKPLSILPLVLPNDLPSTTPPSLTSDAEGRIAVYRGQDPAVTPPVKYVFNRIALTVAPGYLIRLLGHKRSLIARC
jgi:hypothetical protein